MTWESPRVLALIFGGTALLFGTAAALVGYQLASTSPAPALIVVFQPGAIRIELPGTAPGAWP